LNYPPKGIEYLGSSKTNEGEYYGYKKVREKINIIMQKLRIPRMMPIQSGDFDLIHSSRGIIPLTSKNWVMDIEHVHSFFGLNPRIIRGQHQKKFIERKLKADNCKAILCHCKATREAFFYYLNCKKFKNKIKVLYPASHIIKMKKIPSKKIRILALLSIFEAKGGIQILKAFSILEKRNKNIQLIFRSNIPEEIKKKYNSKNIIYMDYSEFIPREELIKKVYSQADIFLYPTFCDSFGYSLIDALVSKLPIVATNLFAVPEIVKDGKNGFIIDIPGYNLEEGYIQEFFPSNFSGEESKEFIQKMVSKLEKLIKSKKLREKMGEESFKLVKTGKFSIKSRNDKLKKIYDEAK